MKNTDYIQSFATFSQDKKRRMSLFRQWDDGKPIAMVIGLNPSTADDNDDDPTIGFVYRVLNFNGFGGFFMMNLFTMITPNPKELITDCNFEEAKELWLSTSRMAKTVVFAWGAFKQTHGRDFAAIKLFPDALCFGRLKKGQPRHPMYLKENTQLIPFK